MNNLHLDLFPRFFRDNAYKWISVSDDKIISIANSINDVAYTEPCMVHQLGTNNVIFLSPDIVENGSHI